MIDQTVEPMVENAIGQLIEIVGWPVKELEFMMDGVRMLRKGRNLLKNSYIYLFYVDKNHPKKPLVE
jgi:hypothetical protein